MKDIPLSFRELRAILGPRPPFFKANVNGVARQPPVQVSEGAHS